MNPVLWFSRHRRRGVALVVMLVFIGTAGVWLGTNLRAETGEKPLAPPKDKSPDLYKYMGADSCGGPGCHGLMDSKKRKFTISQDEYYRWKWNADKESNKTDFGHSGAFDNLKTPESRRIAKNLGLKSPETEPRCLACHAVAVDDNRRGPNYDLTEGVTCEGCHGPAEQWLGPHTRRDWDKKKGAAYGMIDTKNLVKRAERCLACHQGTEKYNVDHELIGAGHPRLNFEMDAYSELMPVHWIVPKEEKDWNGARTWAVSQAVSLRSQLEQLSMSRKGQALLWPDLTQFDCYACHHDVVDRVRGIAEEDKKYQRWRFKEYPNKKPGRLVWNAANYSVFRHAVREIAPDKAGAFDDLVSKFHESLTGKGSVAEFEQALSKLEQMSGELAAMMEKHQFTQKEVWSMLRRITGDGSAIANAGFQSAEQAVFAVTSLQDSYKRTVGSFPNAKSMDASINQLNDDITYGRKFNSEQFSQHLSTLRKLLEPDVPPVSGTGSATPKPVS